jgi:single-stranded-DNA-specific exonuclease
LINRGLVDCDRASSFLRPSLKDLHDPFLLKDMDKAVERTLEAVDRGEKIAVYGDYDVDGTTSTALLYLFFREIGVEARCYIPDRVAEGYGLNAEAVRKLAAEGVKLIITVDCGSSDHDEIALAGGLGIDVIVSDHHELPDVPPGALAVLNPKHKDCPFPFKGLAGVGVAFNFLMALRSRLRDTGRLSSKEPNLKQYLDLVCIGTVADMVPLVGENRVLVRYGIAELEKTKRPGLAALKEVAGLRPGRLDADCIAYQIAPRINAAGRVGQATSALKLLVSQDPAEAMHLATLLNRENVSRQKLEGEIFIEALEMIGERAAGKGIVLHCEGWHPGVIGIVASRLVERFSKPVVMIALDGEVGKGSARGVRSFNILEGLKSSAGLLERFGGHKAAAGLTISRGNIESFKAGFLKYLDESVTEDDLTPEILLDSVVSLEEVDKRLLDEIDSLGPFGVSNREPLLCVSGAGIVASEVVGKKHLRVKVSQNGCARSGIGFGLSWLHPMNADVYSLVFSPYMDEWQGGKNLKLRIKDVKEGCVNFLT